MKIRTDFVTNSSSSSFTLIIKIGLKAGKPICYEATGGVGEGDEEFYELVATKSPKELGASESIDELIEALKESVGQDGLYGEGPANEENRVLYDSSPFIKKIKKLSSMDEISTIEITGNLDGRNEHWYRTYIYDMDSGEMKEEEDGEDFLSEGTGGGLNFSASYGTWKNIGGRSYFGTEKQIQKDYEKQQEKYRDYKNTMANYLNEGFEKYLAEIGKEVSSDIVSLISADEDIFFDGKKFSSDYSVFSPEIREEIRLRGGILYSGFGKKSDYYLINLKTPDYGYFTQAKECIDNGLDIKIVSEYQLWKALFDPEKRVYSEEELQEKARAEQLAKEAERLRKKQEQEAEKKRKQEERAQIKALKEQEALEAKERREKEKFEKAQARLLAEQEKKERARKQKEEAKQEEQRHAEEEREKKQAALQAARASANILYAPGQEPEPLRKRIQSLMEKLDGAYPDHVIVRLAKDHTHWDETVTELYRKLGYADRASFLEAYGFKMNSDKGGRPTTLDANAVIEELKRRYPAGAGAMKMEELKAANPDLPLKSLQNQANELLGMTLVKYLKAQGILG